MLTILSFCQRFNAEDFWLLIMHNDIRIVSQGKMKYWYFCKENAVRHKATKTLEYNWILHDSNGLV